MAWIPTSLSQKSSNEDETDQFIEIEDRYFIAAHLCHLLSGLGELGGGWGQERVVGFLLSSPPSHAGNKLCRTMMSLKQVAVIAKNTIIQSVE